MLKIIGFIFILFSGISLIIITSLFNGIEINDFSYKNLNIKKLYLKYDKNLNISIPKLAISDANTNEKIEITTNFTLNYSDFHFKLDVTKFKLHETDLFFTGLVHLNPSIINLKNKSEILIENLNLSFDSNLAPIKANKVFTTYSNNIINLTFDKAFYQKVNLSESTVKYLLDNNELQLYLKSNSLFSQSIKNLLFYYDINIPINQIKGINKISTNIFIPFTKGDLEVEAKVHVKDSSIKTYDQVINLSNAFLHYKNDKLQGDVYLNDYIYEDFNITDSNISYNVSFEQNILVNIKSNKINIEHNQSKFYFNNPKFIYQNNVISFDTNITDSQRYLQADINSTINFEHNTTQGLLSLNYNNNDHNISLHARNIIFNGDFKNDFLLDVHSKELNISRPMNIDINNLKLNYQNNIINTSLNLKDNNQYDIHLVNQTDLNKKISNGNIEVNKLKYKNFIDLNNKDIPYNLSFKDMITVKAPTLGLAYFKKDKSLHELNINKPNKILDIFTFIKTHKKSNANIRIKSKDFNNTTVAINNVNFDINSSFFTSDTNTSEKILLPMFPKLNISYINSTIKYDNYTIPFDKIKIISNHDTLNITMKKENTSLAFKSKGNKVQLNAHKINDIYLNTFLNKKILDKGYIDVNVYGDDINHLSGDINFYKTTIKNIAIVNNLITFVNTTPAIINPLLALPTLFRLAETGFDTNGYYIKHGSGSLRYDFKKNSLDIYDLYTNGKMSNFIINSHINLTTKQLNTNVDISFFKDFTKAIKHVPVLGYIVMGDDGEFHTSVDITGTLDNPILETHTVKEGTRGITGVIKRILTLPLQPLNFESTEEEKKEHEKRIKEILK